MDNVEAALQRGLFAPDPADKREARQCEGYAVRSHLKLSTSAVGPADSCTTIHCDFRPLDMQLLAQRNTNSDLLRSARYPATQHSSAQLTIRDGLLYTDAIDWTCLDAYCRRQRHDIPAGLTFVYFATGNNGAPVACLIDMCTFMSFDEWSFRIPSPPAIANVVTRLRDQRILKFSFIPAWPRAYASDTESKWLQAFQRCQTGALNVSKVSAAEKLAAHRRIAATLQELKRKAEDDANQAQRNARLRRDSVTANGLEVAREVKFDNSGLSALEALNSPYKAAALAIAAKPNSIVPQRVSQSQPPR